MEYNDIFVESKLPQPFSDEELYIYFQRMNSGDLLARQEIIEHNIRLVLKIVKVNFSNAPYDKKELVSVGLIGLVKSIDTFDISKNFKFATYATRCIRNEILLFMKKGNKHIKNCSLDEPLHNVDEDFSLEYKDVICDESVDFVTDYENQESYQVMRTIISRLPEKNRRIIEMHFGFKNNEPMSQREIADILGISQSYVSRIIKKTLRIISIELQEQGIIEKNLNFTKKKQY